MSAEGRRRRERDASSGISAEEPADASYLAEGPGGMQLALVAHDGRLQAYAGDGTARRAFFSGRARSGHLVLRSKAGDRLALRVGAGSVRATLTLDGGDPLRLTARRARAAIFRVTIRPDGAVFGTALSRVLGATTRLRTPPVNENANEDVAVPAVTNLPLDIG